MCATTGKAKLATPTFDVNSVIVPVVKQIIVNIKKGDSSFKSLNEFPILAAKQDSVVPLEMAKPPPNKNMRDQGIFFSIRFQVINPSDDLVARLDSFGKCSLFVLEKFQSTTLAKLTVFATTVYKFRFFWDKEHQNRYKYYRSRIFHASATMKS